MLVVVRHGPATERGALALRTALALGLGGFEVTVLLKGAASAFATRELDVPWLGGDPAADLAGLIDELGADVAATRAAEGALRPGVRVVHPGETSRLHVGADLVVAS